MEAGAVSCALLPSDALRSDDMQVPDPAAGPFLQRCSGQFTERLSFGDDCRIEHCSVCAFQFCFFVQRHLE